MLFRAFAWVSWNTLLALIPVVLAYTIQGISCSNQGHSSSVKKVLMMILGLAWLAFIPNTCYLLTEWRHFLSYIGYSGLWATWHLDSGAALQMMVYTLFYAIYSGIGVVTFALAIRPIANIVRQRGASLWIWGMLFFLLMSVGVYLGLVLRFNSWDLLSRPELVWRSMLQVLERPILFAFIVIFAMFLWVLYFTVDIWMDGLAARFGHLRQAFSGCKQNR